MYTKEVRDKFILLRAQGYSYRKIAKELNVDKTTIMKWAHENEFAIIQKRFELADENAELYRLARDEYFKNLLEEWRRVNQEIKRRNLEEISFGDLLRYRDNLEVRVINFLNATQKEEYVLLRMQDDDYNFLTLAGKYHTLKNDGSTKEASSKQINKQINNLLESLF